MFSIIRQSNTSQMSIQKHTKHVQIMFGMISLWYFDSLHCIRIYLNMCALCVQAYGFVKDKTTFFLNLKFLEISSLGGEISWKVFHFEKKKKKLKFFFLKDIYPLITFKEFTIKWQVNGQQVAPPPPFE